MIGFRPEFKIVTTYPNPLTLIYSRVKDMYLTLTGLVSPASDVKLRNMSGPVGIVNHLSVFAKIGFKKLLWFVVLLMSIWPSSICYPSQYWTVAICFCHH